MKQIILALIAMLYIAGANAQVITLDTTGAFYRSFQSVQPNVNITGLNSSLTYTSNWNYSYDGTNWYSDGSSFIIGQTQQFGSFGFCGDSLDQISFFHTVRQGGNYWYSDTIVTNVNLTPRSDFGLRMSGDVPQFVCQDSLVYMRNVYYGPSGTITNMVMVTSTSQGVQPDWIMDTMLLMVNGTVVASGYDTIPASNGWQTYIVWNLLPNTIINHLDAIEIWLGETDYGNMSIYLTTFEKELNINGFSEDIFSWDVDWYSSKNNIDTTYSISYDANHLELSWGRIRKDYWKYNSWNISIALNCKRKGDEVLEFYILVIDGFVVKVWQYPSLADIQFAEIGKKYDKTLHPEELANLKRAIWLNAHWVGAWAFVYLRRIFENLIFETYQDSKIELKLVEEDFLPMRMNEKVETLKKVLPAQLVEMKGIYSILSKWVHELSEDECKKYFAAIKLSIELILDQKIKMKEEKEKQDRVVKEITLITKNLS